MCFCFVEGGREGDWNGSGDPLLCTLRLGRVRCFFRQQLVSYIMLRLSSVGTHDLDCSGSAWRRYAGCREVWASLVLANEPRRSESSIHGQVV